MMKSDVTYERAVHSQAPDANLWIRPNENPQRLCMMQFSTACFRPTRTIADDYYDMVYKQVSGYHRPVDFWELPQWVAMMAYHADGDLYIIRDIEEAVKFVNQTDYEHYAFSAIDVTVPFIDALVQRCIAQFIVGGPADLVGLLRHPNVTVMTLTDFVKSNLVGYEYGHFDGTKTIPRISLSTGCQHDCSFCSVERGVTLRSWPQIQQQVENIAECLDYELVYVDDKTFGQAANHTLLPNLAGTQGYIVQTTAGQMKQLDAGWMRDAGIRYVELGIESFNDVILKAARKPATERVIDEAVDKIRKAGLRLIPNLIVGLPGETVETYQRTLDWLDQNADVVSHINAYNLAVYDAAPMRTRFKVIWLSDRDENQVQKSFYTDPQLHAEYHDALFSLAMELLANLTPSVPSGRMWQTF